MNPSRWAWLAAGSLYLIWMLTAWTLFQIAAPADIRQTWLATAGDPKALYIAGIRCQDWGLVRDPDKAIRYFERAAIKGYAPAQHRLAQAYARGSGGLKLAPSQAVIWENKAAEQGFAPAQYSLGILIETGKGAASDEGRALAWFQKSAEQGFAPAMHELGLAYQTGRAVRHDLARAYQWHVAEQRRAKRECPQAAYLLRLIKKDQVLAANARAASFLDKLPKASSF